MLLCVLAYSTSWYEHMVQEDAPLLVSRKQRDNSSSQEGSPSMLQLPSTSTPFYLLKIPQLPSMAQAGDQPLTHKSLGEYFGPGYSRFQGIKTMIKQVSVVEATQCVKAP